MSDPRFADNPARGRFELSEGGLLAWAEYQIQDGVYVIPHVEAEPPLRGTGAAGRLMTAIAQEARSKGFKLDPRCPYARIWFQRHPGARDVLA